MEVKRWADEPVEQMSETVGRQMIHTETMTLARVYLRQGAVVPQHEHPNEQIVNVLEGQLRIVADGEVHVVSAGESLFVPANVPHDAEALEDSVVLDVFSPPRADWISGDDAYLRR
jgi:quercetin dioxygenase-like cupin family protein